MDYKEFKKKSPREVKFLMIKSKKQRKQNQKLKVTLFKWDINKISPKMIDHIENSSVLKDEVIRQILKNPKAREQLAERIKEELF